MYFTSPQTRIMGLSYGKDLVILAWFV